MKVVISQPMFFPWIGLFEQWRLCDLFVHFDDVQLPQGRSFVNRVQIKSHQGSQWLTVPLRSGESLIKDVRIDVSQNWREKHLRSLNQSYGRAPFFSEMIGIVEQVYSKGHELISDLNCCAIETVGKYLCMPRTSLHSASLGLSSKSSERILQTLKEVGGTEYITGHGARNYLDHERLESEGIRIGYMSYLRRPYPQQHGAFDPHVSILDLIANTGSRAAEWIGSPAVDWREFLEKSA